MVEQANSWSFQLGFESLYLHLKGLSAIGEVTRLLNVWMMNPCEFESHVVRIGRPPWHISIYN